VNLRACLDDMEKREFLILPRLELRPLGRPARSQSLYRLRYPRLTDRIYFKYKIDIRLFITNSILISSAILLLSLGFTLYLQVHVSAYRRKWGGTIVAAAGSQKLVIWLEYTKTSQNSRLFYNSYALAERSFFLNQFMLTSELI
jgi:hypothetical protein